MSAPSDPLVAAQRWLQTHSGSSNTRRKYDAQLQQFCEWLVLGERDLINVDTSDVGRYLSDVAQGTATLSTRNRGATRSGRTVMLARSVLSTLFEALMREGLRPDNPARLATLSQAIDARQSTQERTNATRWLEIRAQVIESARGDKTPRSALRRAVAIAELASWAGLRRSELAAATMGNFRQMGQRWWVKLPRFGRGAEDLIEVPQAAMDALSMYRICRDLPELPQTAEERVPLIARVASEAPVSSWAVAHALKDLQPSRESSEEGRRRPPTIVALRRDVASEALSAKIAAHQLARHMRSRTLVDQVTLEMDRAPIGRALQRLAA